MPKISTSSNTSTLAVSQNTPTIPNTGVESVSANTSGDGYPIFLGKTQDTAGNLTLGFSSIKAGTNVSLDNHTTPGTIVINASVPKANTKFFELIDGPQGYRNNSLLGGTQNGISWLSSPTIGNPTFLHWNGQSYEFKTAVQSVSIVGTTGQIITSGSSITDSGTITVGLASIGSQGTYDRVNVDSFGRVTGGQTNAIPSMTFTGDVSGTGTGSINLSLPNVGTAGTYTNITIDTKGRVTSARALNTADISSLGFALLSGPTFTGTPKVATPTLNAYNTNIVNSSWVNQQGYLIGPLTLSGDVTGVSSGKTITTSLASIPYSKLPAEVQTTTFTFSFPVLTTGSQIVVPVIQNTTIPANFVNSVGYASTAPAASATFTLTYVRSGVSNSLGTIVFAASQHSATFSSTVAISLLAGDILIITVPSSVDANLKNVGISIAALKT